MPIRIFQVDAFTGELFKGNPAAVCLLEHSMPDDWMLQLAREMNLSETAFLLPLDTGYSLRWFTPKIEVSLCGHATLASAHVLFETGIVPKSQTAHFSTLSGELKARHTQEGIELDFPTMPSTPAAEVPTAMLDALNVTATAVMTSGNKHLIEVGTEAEVRTMQPDFDALSRLTGRGVTVTARANSDSEYDFVSRYFAPWIGINEDPVTGSAHCILGPYWAKKLEKTELHAYQASLRGGALKLRVTPERTYLTGQAVTVFSGEME
jgi:PhzF family phenazine biosynthesis protein